MELTPDQLEYFGHLLEDQTGQQLSPGRRWRLDVALQAILARFDLADLDTLLARLKRGDPPLAEAVAHALLNHETFFFRDQPVFAHLVGAVLPALAAQRAASRRLRIWSAGCSTGQEPYSLAYALARDAERWAGWTIDIVATDISPQVIDRARMGVYSQFEAQRGLSIQQLLGTFEQVGDLWRIDDRLRRAVRFHRHSLLDAPPPGGPFDLILCRNVLFYFPPARRAAVFDRLAAGLAPDGRLVLGAGETVMGQTDAFAVDPGLRGLYRHRPVGEEGLAHVA